MMSNNTYAQVPPGALTGSMRDFRVPGGADLLGRTHGFFHWQDLRRQNGLWPFSRATEDGPGTVCSAQDDSGNSMRGVNFAAGGSCARSQPVHGGAPASGLAEDAHEDAA